jgi:hypothetical protein
LRATCRRFRVVLPIITTVEGHHPKGICKAYTALVDSTCFRVMCAREKDGCLERGMLVCGACQSSHLVGFFTVEEQAREPEKRECIRRQHRVTVCTHWRMSYHRIMEYLRTAETPECLWDNCPARYEIRSKLRLYRVDVEGRWDTKVDTTLELGTVDYKFETEWVGQGFKRANWWVCPHLNTFDVELWAR